ncbi:MAG: LAGLIDADG family homing endonuclease [Candidatus Kerfeldbacteria bacterium]|nr:LAGLIDADG family homing endonuclease [Candidatus Kerfeldbacteria bacterium]
MASENVLSADNQQERLRLPHPWYIVGLVDGEGSFHIALYKDERMKTQLKVIPEFHVSQNSPSKIVLEELQQFFQCGYIKVNHRGSKTDHTYVYVVRNRDDLLKRIIPFFQQYSLRTMKAKDFQFFAKVVHMMNEGKHQTGVGAKGIITTAYQMNDSGKRRKVAQQDLIRIVESSETIRETSQ